MSWYTRLAQPSRREIQAVSAPALVYHKWHAYDLPALDIRESRREFLELVANGVNHLVSGEVYTNWYARYMKALDAIHATQELKGSTLWRLVSGFATNPALESGLHLHPLYGFPYLPGSAVRGLVHHVAEMELIEEGIPENAEGRRHFLDAVERIKTIFGSVFVRPLPANPIETPWSVIDAWRRENGTTAEDRKRMSALLDQHTGGLLAFYDAVPEPGQDGLLQTDILNPHYPDYYDNQGKKPPSDDQDPRPVYFLAVKPGTSFRFRFRTTGRPAEPELEDLPGKVRGWLQTGLEEWGAGAKTAAGYGYFQMAPGSSSKG